MPLMNKIESILKEAEQPYTILDPSPEFPYHRLLVYSEGMGKREGELIEITIRPTLEHELGEELASPTHSTSLMQFQYVFSKEISMEAVSQISSALHFFNRLLHCPGFELDELNDRVLYRYVWFVNEDDLNLPQFMQVYGNVQLCIKLFSPYISNLLDGRLTFDQILQEVVQSQGL